MRLRRLGALMAITVALGYACDVRRKYDLQPASQFLFDWRQTSTPCDPPQTQHGGVLVRGQNPPAHTVRRLDILSFSRAELPALSMHSGPAMIEVTGADTQTYSVQLCAQAGAASEEDAKLLLEQIKLIRQGETLEVSAPQYSQERPSHAYVRVQAPRDAPVTISGNYAAMWVYGMSAEVKISTTHARLTVLETTGDVEAAIKPDSGMIDFSGNRGHVRLNADWEINLNISAQQFAGTLEAIAQGPVRVLLPPGFASPFETVVKGRSDFACRAAICNHVRRVDRAGKLVFTYGSGEPVLRLASVSGPVVIDTTNQLPPAGRWN